MARGFRIQNQGRGLFRPSSLSPRPSGAPGALSSTSTGPACRHSLHAALAGLVPFFCVLSSGFSTGTGLAARVGRASAAFLLGALSSTSTAQRCVACRLQTPKAGWRLSFRGYR